MEKGIDISVHNGIVNIAKVKNEGYGRIFVRAGYGKDNDDQRYAANAEACLRHAVPTGIYWFSYGYTEAMAAAEGRYAVAAAKRYWNRCPIAF
ncbi:MAG: glycosyl hydrolase, partial [Lachnospiraceae bacterium]|nr:glycosyl hydrolase [Lachnospiraceae bacterium]